MFGFGRRRRAAAEEAAREAERRALFAELAKRPPNICPFLGLAYERTGYVDGASIEHRCFAFGDPAPLSSEQQTRVCQERGYGQCPRYLRGLLVTPSEELQALRQPQAATLPLPDVPAASSAHAESGRGRRRAGRVVIGVLLLVVLVGAGVAAYALLSSGDGVDQGVGGVSPTPVRSATPFETAAASAAPESTEPSDASDAPSAAASAEGAPTPEPTPVAGDQFAFYEVAVSPGRYQLYEVGADGAVGEERGANFGDFSFARVEPVEGDDGLVYWRTAEGGLAGLAYRYPESGEFRIRAVYLDAAGTRRSAFLDESDLDVMPEATPAP